MRWGLVPSWWKKKAKETPATFNARAKTVIDKKAAWTFQKQLNPRSADLERLYGRWIKQPTRIDDKGLFHGQQSPIKFGKR
jgi:hypothetical protein